MKKIICIGSGSKDIFFPTSEMKIIDNPGNLAVKKLVAFEYGAKYQIEDRFEAPGGCAVNSSQGLARIGIDVACYCRVGNDYEGSWVKDSLKDEKVDISLIQTDDSFKTDLSAILINKNDGDRTIFFNRDANEKLEIDPNLESKWFFVSALNGDWQGNIDKIIKIVEEKNIRLAVNPGQANLKENREKVFELIEKAEILILNRDEAIDITGNKSDDIKFLFSELSKFGPKMIGMTDGEDGSYALDGEKIIFAKATKENPIDLTGAGDGFGSGFLSAIIKEKEIKDALKWGVANGGNVVNFYGAKEGLMNEDQIVEKAEMIEVEEIK